MRDDSFAGSVPSRVKDRLADNWVRFGICRHFSFSRSPSESLFGIFPVCAAKAAGGQCLLCGMTTAFVHIGSRTIWTAARQANGGSLFFYTALTLNFVAVLLAYTMMRVFRHANS